MPRIVVLEIQKPPDLQWLNSNDRRFRFDESKVKRAWRSLGWSAVMTQLEEVVPFTNLVVVTALIYKPINNRYDPNNLWATTKPIMDGIVDSGLLVDDDWKHVSGPDHRHGGKGEPRIVLRIEEQ